MPKITDSEIFAEYEKIAEQSGLVKNAAESKELKDYKNSVQARIGSDTLKAIEELYGLRPDPDDYEENIMEKAHPKSVIIAPSYDKVNGLVENNIERQNINIKRVLKQPTGNHIHFKLARQQLMLELVKIANYLDSTNQEELRKKADGLIEEISTRKTAAIPFLGLAAGTAAAAAALGALWYMQNSDDPDSGIHNSAKTALQKLEALQDKSWYEGVTDSAVKKDVSYLTDKINKVLSVVNEFKKIEDSFYSPATLSDSEEIKKLQDSVKTQGSALNKTVKLFTATLQDLKPALKTAIDNFRSERYQKEHQEQTWLGQMSGKLGDLLHGASGLLANDFTTAANALGGLLKSVDASLKRADEMQGVVEKKKEELDKSEEKKSDSSPTTPKSVEKSDDSHSGFDLSKLKSIEEMLGRSLTDVEKKILLK